MPAGYSTTSLAKKLGIKTGSTIRIINPPNNYFELFTAFPPDVSIKKKASKDMDFIHFFITSMKEIERDLSQLKKEIKKDGIIWISWHKKSSKIPTDVTEDKIRNIALKEGLVDVKVCAIDETWSGLKLVYRIKDR